MKLTKSKLKQIIRESIRDLTEGKMITLELTQEEANSLLLALERVEQSPEIEKLYGKILDAGIGDGFGATEERAIGLEKD
tara:strand:+ start:1844 stop:2083 length:240 start_codon:yes stop_codon:yes gene_type:complete